MRRYEYVQNEMVRFPGRGDGPGPFGGLGGLGRGAVPVARGELRCGRATAGPPPAGPPPLGGAAPARAPLVRADPPLWCNAWVVTNYWSDASHTTKVGQCSITCFQYDQVSAYPTFIGGGTCTGVSSAYTNQLTTLCRCVP